MRNLAVVLFAAFCLSCAASPAAFPLKLSAGKHYLVDQNNQPFFMQGDSGWTLPFVATNYDMDLYMADRAKKGFNTVNCELIEKFYMPSDPTNWLGQLPFTNFVSGANWDFGTVNPNYFTNVDNLLRVARNYDIQIIMFVAWLGSSDSRGFNADISANTKLTLTNYGKFLGNRYMSQPNLIWGGGGDRNTADIPSTDAIMYGILSVDSNHLCLAHPPRETNGKDYFTASWDAINTVYTTTNRCVQKSLDAYNTSPVIPAFMVESIYYREEGDNNLTDLVTRQTAYGSILNGCCGHSFGAFPVYELTNAANVGWQSKLSEGANTNITFVMTLVTNRQWYNWIPDTNHAVVTSGFGTFGQTNYASTVIDVASNSIVTYLPQGSNLLPVVAMTKIAAPFAKANWFSPTNGATYYIGTYPTTGTKTFQAPDSLDWILTLDAYQPSSPNIIGNGAIVNISGSGATITIQ